MRRLETYEGVVEKGQVKLPTDVTIPENTRVYVLVPDSETPSLTFVASPHLVDPQQAKDFDKQVIENATDANL
jgi:hypothetical protein